MSEEQKQNTTGQPEFQAEFQAIVEACERLKVLSVQSGKKLDHLLHSIDVIIVLSIQYVIYTVSYYNRYSISRKCG